MSNTDEKTIRISGLVPESIVDGPGLRLTLFTQGCSHRCEGCHNPQTHDPAGGYESSVREIFAQIEKNPLLSGVTLSGGEPFLQAGALLPLAERIKGQGLNLAVYSGYTLEELLEKEPAEPAVGALLRLCDVLVDGRFILAQRTLSGRFAGSRNQRCLDVARSLLKGRAVLAEKWQ